MGYFLKVSRRTDSGNVVQNLPAGGSNSINERIRIVRYIPKLICFAGVQYRKDVVRE